MTRAAPTYASEETWDLVREGYLRGATGPQLAEHFGVTATALYKRALREGWPKKSEVRRVTEAPALPAPAPWIPPRLAVLTVEPTAEGLAAAALIRAAEAMEQGRHAAAQGYLRVALLARRLDGQALDGQPLDDGSEPPLSVEEDIAECSARIELQIASLERKLAIKTAEMEAEGLLPLETQP